MTYPPDFEDPFEDASAHVRRTYARRSPFASWTWLDWAVVLVYCYAVAAFLVAFFTPVISI